MAGVAVNQTHRRGKVDRQIGVLSLQSRLIISPVGAEGVRKCCVFVFSEGFQTVRADGRHVDNGDRPQRG